MVSLLHLILVVPLLIAGCAAPAKFPSQPGDVFASADYLVQATDGNYTLHLELGAARIRGPDGNMATVRILNGTYEGAGIAGTWSRALGDRNHVLRHVTCREQRCNLAWSVDGNNVHGFGLLEDYEQDGVVDIWMRSMQNPNVGSRLSLEPTLKIHGNGTTELSIGDAAGFLSGTYWFADSSDMPLALQAAEGTKNETRWQRRSLALGIPLPETILGWAMPTVASGNSVLMFRGESEDFLGAGFSPLQALQHLLNSSTEAKSALDAGCVASFRVFFRADGVGQGEQIEIGIMPSKGGSPIVWMFNSIDTTTILGMSPLFGEVVKKGSEPGFPMAGDCGMVAASPRSIDAGEFLLKARALELSNGGEIAFQWFVGDLAGQKPAWPGVTHFGLLLYPVGTGPETLEPVQPYSIRMDGDIGFWEGLTFAAQDLPQLDS